MGIGLIQPMHLLLILLIVLVVFGAGKLSQVGGALGQSVKEFKETVNSDDEDAGDVQPAGDAAARLARAEQQHVSAAAPRAARLLQREEI